MQYAETRRPTGRPLEGLVKQVAGSAHILNVWLREGQV